MRMIGSVVIAVLWFGCGGTNTTDDDGGGDEVTPQPPDTCEGLRCQITDCAKLGRRETTISGTVFAPNGTLPLHGVTVYVPNQDPGPFTDGVKCERCVSQLPGDPIVQTVSDETGRFSLAGVPSGADIPLVITVGKWRRQLKLPVTPCVEHPLPAEQTSLPKNKLEGDLPKIAMVTGRCDALECLVRKLGVDVDEFTPDDEGGRIHLFASNGVDRVGGDRLVAPAAALWDDLDKLKQYDLAMFGCECSQEAAGKSQQAMLAVKAYADAGGRAFFSHYHSMWISGEYGVPSHAPPVWPTVAQCDLDLEPTGTGVIDEVNNPRGLSFARWMSHVGGSTSFGRLPVNEARQTCRSIDPTKAERWLYLEGDGGTQVLQNFQFTTPVELGSDQRCGKVVLSDMHVASGSSSYAGEPFPSGCSTGPLTPQEKALAFMFFDIASCVGPIF